MKTKSYSEAKRRYNPDDEVLACAYKYTGDKEGRANFQEPILGRLMAGKNENSDRALRSRSYVSVGYFVPYKKNNRDLCWSKAVSIDARCYADSKEECVELYNELIQKNIGWHEEEIEKLKRAMIEYDDQALDR